MLDVRVRLFLFRLAFGRGWAFGEEIARLLLFPLSNHLLFCSRGAEFRIGKANQRLVSIQCRFSGFVGESTSALGLLLGGGADGRTRYRSKPARFSDLLLQIFLCRDAAGLIPSPASPWSFFGLRPVSFGLAPVYLWSGRPHVFRCLWIIWARRSRPAHRMLRVPSPRAPSERSPDLEGCI